MSTEDIPLIQRDILKCWQAEQEAIRGLDKQRAIDVAVLKEGQSDIKESLAGILGEQKLLREAKHLHSNNIQNINGQITCIFNDIGEIKTAIHESDTRNREDMAYIREKLAGNDGKDKVLGWILQKAATPIIVGIVGAILALILMKGGK